jgi:hypothetical protein
MRSRLEARWAIFFDALNIKWVYEPEGFEFEGIKYLPDFYLPAFDGGMFVEVKFKATKEEIQKCHELSKLTKTAVLICEGTPGPQCLRYFNWYDDHERYGYPKYDHGYQENRMWDTGGESTITEREIAEGWPDPYIEAIKAARSARFEHNEKSL